MDTQVILPEQALPAKLVVNPELPLSDDDYYALCMANPDVRFERSSQGEIIIVPPVGGESSNQSGEAFRQLANWALPDSRGKTFDSSADFILPTRAALSPDAAWVSNTRLAPLSKEERRTFLRLCPEFIVEVMSPSDRLKPAMEKMKEWLRAGVDLAWLIDGDSKTVYIYRAGGSEPDKHTGIAQLSGEGPIAGFDLDLTRIWAGL